MKINFFRNCLHNKLLKQHNKKFIKNEKVLVHFFAKSDHNGAIASHSPSMYFNLHFQKNYKVIYRQVSSTTEIENHIKEIKNLNNSIHGLWIHAHGNSKSLRLGEGSKESVLHVSNAGSLHYSFNALESDATIILQSCSTGKVNDHHCLAQTIADVAKGRTVIAPTKSCNSIGVNLSLQKKKISFQFTIEKTSKLKGFLGKLHNFLYLMLYILSFGYYGESITAKFKSVKR